MSEDSDELSPLRNKGATVKRDATYGRMRRSDANLDSAEAMADSAIQLAEALMRSVYGAAGVSPGSEVTRQYRWPALRSGRAVSTFSKRRADQLLIVRG